MDEGVMFSQGVLRGRAREDALCSSGNGRKSTYGKSIIDAALPGLADYLRARLWKQQTGPVSACFEILRTLDPKTVALTALSSTCNYLLSSDNLTLRALAYAVGQSVHRELCMAELAKQLPGMAIILDRSFDRTRTTDENRRYEVYAGEARAHGIPLPDWPRGHRDVVGLYLVGMLAELGIVDIGKPVKKGHGRVTYRPVYFSEAATDAMSKAATFSETTRPMYMPLSHPPADWVSHDRGGFISDKVRSANPTLVRHRLGDSEALGGADMPDVYLAVNSLQRVAWRINHDVLKVALTDGVWCDELMVDMETPMPETLDFNAPDVSETTIAEWKALRKAWFETRALRRCISRRYYTATRMATELGEAPFYFVYFLDSRGRAYPLTQGVSPQGSDLQKALIQFDTGQELADPVAVHWFLVNGANLWGFDKAPLKERAQWSRDNAAMITSIAKDPLGCQEWTKADKRPLQFLAWCFEFDRWLTNPRGFKTYLPVFLDGTCNGLQHLSALFRDQVGAEVTNLRRVSVRGDAYGTVASNCQRQLTDDFWGAHGVPRAAVKRIVMTTPYGVTPTSATKYVVKEYLEKVQPAGLSPADYYAEARKLVDAKERAIAEDLPGCSAALAWLEKCGTLLGQEAKDGVVSWTSPLGFPAYQHYAKAERHKVGAKFFGNYAINVCTESAESDVTKHRRGFAPNFIHSLDAAHMQDVVCRLVQAGVRNLAMTHDSFAVAAPDVQHMYTLTRQSFVDIYTKSDPLEALLKQYPNLPVPPVPGNLDVTEVMDNEYFFS